MRKNYKLAKCSKNGNIRYKNSDLNFDT